MRPWEWTNQDRHPEIAALVRQLAASTDPVENIRELMARPWNNPQDALGYWNQEGMARLIYLFQTRFVPTHSLHHLAGLPLGRAWHRFAAVGIEYVSVPGGPDGPVVDELGFLAGPEVFLLPLEGRALVWGEEVEAVYRPSEGAFFVRGSWPRSVPTLRLKLPRLPEVTRWRTTPASSGPSTTR